MPPQFSEQNQFTGGRSYPRAEIGEYGDNFLFRAIVANTEGPVIEAVEG
jgi:hypothetical protein